MPLLSTSAGIVSGRFSQVALAPPGTLQYEPSAVNWMIFKTGDINGDNVVNLDDLLAVIAGWGPCPALPAACPADVDANGVVNVDDLLAVISHWS